MARGRALVVGLRGVDPNAYNGDRKANGVEGAEKDVDRVCGLLAGYAQTALKTQQATAAAVLGAIGVAAAELVEGDIFVFYFAGHGIQQVDTDGDENDGQDEVLLAFDRPIVDDELRPLWRMFAPGVRIVMVSDSCHSGTNFEFAPPAPGETAPAAPPVMTVRSADMRAMMIHIGAARDGTKSQGAIQGGKFTTEMAIYLGANPGATGYAEGFRAISATIEGQAPVFNAIGPVTAAFLAQRMFAV